MRNSTRFPIAVGALAALLLCGAASAQTCPNNDVFEGNNSCALGVPIQLPLGTTNGLTVGTGVGGTDYWEYTLGVNETVIIDVLFSDAVGDIDAKLLNEPCNTTISTSLTATDNEQLIYTNVSGAPIEINLWVYYTFGPIPSCQDYSLLVTSVIDVCLAGGDDAYAPNHDCASAAALAPGTYTDLVTHKSIAEDFFAVEVPAGETLNVDVLFTDADGDIDVYIYELSTFGTTCGNKVNYLVRGFSASDNESVSITNNFMWQLTYYVQVNMFDLPTNQACNSYDLVIEIVPSLVPTAMCFGDGTSGPCPCGNQSTLGAGQGCASSLGFGSILTANGSTSVGANDLSFTVSQARPNQTGMLLQGASLVTIPFKDGLLCAGNPTERIVPVFTNGAGVGVTLASIVIEGGVNPSDTRYYQMWTRDPGGLSPCGEGSNFSNGVKVTFTP